MHAMGGWLVQIKEGEKTMYTRCAHGEQHIDYLLPMDTQIPILRNQPHHTGLQWQDEKHRWHAYLTLPLLLVEDKKTREKTWRGPLESEKILEKDKGNKMKGKDMKYGKTKNTKYCLVTVGYFSEEREAEQAFKAALEYYHAHKKEIKPPPSDAPGSGKVFWDKHGHWKAWARHVCEVVSRYSNEDYADATAQDDVKVADEESARAGDTLNVQIVSKIPKAEGTDDRVDRFTIGKIQYFDKGKYWIRYEAVDKLTTRQAAARCLTLEEIFNQKELDHYDGPYGKMEGSALHFAAAEGHTKIVHTLVQAGYKLNTTDKELQTPLHVAVAEGRPRVVAKLIEGGANVNAVTIQGMSALHYAAASDAPCARDIAEKLLNGGANPNEVNVRGLSPLHVAVKKQNLSVLRALCMWTKDTNIAPQWATYTDLNITTGVLSATKSSQTALHMACEATGPGGEELEPGTDEHQTAVEIIRCLFSEHQADSSIEDGNGQEPRIDKWTESLRLLTRKLSLQSDECQRSREHPISNGVVFLVQPMFGTDQLGDAEFTCSVGHGKLTGRRCDLDDPVNADEEEDLTVTEVQKLLRLWLNQLKADSQAKATEG